VYFLFFPSTHFPLLAQKPTKMAVQQALERFDQVVAAMRNSKKAIARSEYCKYCTWVEEKGLRPPESAVDKYIHRDALNQYFTSVVVGRNGTMNTVGRIRSSLQWVFDYVESTPEDVPLVVKNSVVDRAIRDQQIGWKSRQHEVNAGSDPHKGLKDLMSVEDKLKIIRFIHKHRNDWGSLSVSWCWGNQAAARGATNRCLVYADLNCSLGFGVPPDGCVLMIVLRRGDVHKDQHTTDKQVGVLRHKHYLLCSTFNTALHVVNDLRNDNTIDFSHSEMDQRASWWDKPLIDYSKYDEEGAAMEAVLAATQVKSCKKTHNRTQAVQLAGSESLAPWQINTMTKHMLEKMHSAYQSEVDKESMKVMAGYSKEEGYFNENSFIQLPRPIGYYIVCLLPKYPQWLEQRDAADGDKSQCCETFLLIVIPYLVRVLVQCGAFFIYEFPDHTMSMYLKVSIFRRSKKRTQIVSN
jgi:hypothetical protein